MPQKITKYKTVDSQEFDTYDEAYAHEQALKAVNDIRLLLIDAVNNTKDAETGRRVYAIDAPGVNAVADMLVGIPDLFSKIQTVLPPWVKQRK